MDKQSMQLVKQVRTELTTFFDKMVAVTMTDELVTELMELRGYESPEMYNTLKEIGFFKVDYLSELLLYDSSIEDEKLRLWGIINAEGNYILTSRYVLPIRGIDGLVCALVGWHPQGGTRKYVTTPTFGFSRDATFFNLDCYQLSREKWDGVVFLVEGIFDAIALRSLGFPAIANQGLELSWFKTQILRRFSKVIALPDNDKSGMGVNPMLNGISGKKPTAIWRIPIENVFAVLPKGIKDVDDFVKFFDCFEDLLRCVSARYQFRIKEEGELPLTDILS